MAIAIGFMVGYAIRYYGKGIDIIFGVLGAILSLCGCLLGNFLSIVGFAASSEGMGYIEVLTSIEYSLIPALIIDTFNPMDLLFYSLAIYEGYKFSFREIKQEDVLANASR